jgi:hypothetical protein
MVGVGLGVALIASPAAGQELLVPGGPYEASAVPAGARGEWLGLVAGDGPDRLVPVRVAVENVMEECTGSPGAARLVRVTSGPSPIVLLRGVPGVREGAVAPGTLAPAVDWRQPQAGSFGGRPFLLREERVGEGFRLRYAWGQTLETVFEAEYEDEGYWAVLWLGDLNRDGWPDLVLQADGKYSLQTTRLLLSRRGVLEEIATFGIAAC